MADNLSETISREETEIAIRLVTAGRKLFFHLNKSLSGFAEETRLSFLRYALTTNGSESSFGVVDADGTKIGALERLAKIGYGDLHVIAFPVYANKHKPATFIPGVFSGLENAPDAFVLSTNDALHQRLQESDQEDGVDHVYAELGDVGYCFGFLTNATSYLRNTQSPGLKTLKDISLGTPEIARSILARLNTNVTHALRGMKARLELPGELGAKLRLFGKEV